MSEAQTKELECVDLILQADATEHPSLSLMVQRLNNAYSETSKMLTEQQGLIELEGADVDVRVVDAKIEAIWNECFSALQAMSRSSTS